ncbi:hypothetical protein GGS20DRAFT_577715 [Poronia punctata]|nr:hypothetical protein GGS20DRAFT_577715 [Poronia punctata]
MKTALITGCSNGGIGSSLARILQQRDFHVYATARDLSKMSDLEGLPNVTFLKLDVVKADDIKAAVEAVKRTSRKGLDCFISNAGRNHFMPILDEDLDAVREIFEINLIAPIALTKAFSPLLIKAKGLAVYITSTAGHLNIPYMGTYAASKIGLEVIGETLRLGLEPFGVDVLEVVTSGVKSKGQTYFEDFKLPTDSVRLYKDIEGKVAGRAQGQDDMPRLETAEYCELVVGDILNRTSGRVWHGYYAEWVGHDTKSAVRQSVMDLFAVEGTGLDDIGE